MGKTKTMTRLLIAAALLASASAFTTIAPTTQLAPVVSTTARNVILTEDEVDMIFKRATDCAESECSVEDVNNLLMDLRDQKKLMEGRLQMIDNMFNKLDNLNSKKQREVDSIRQTVEDFMRVFSRDTPAFMPTQIMGDIGDGPTTAYDALPPKKWTNPAQ